METYGNDDLMDMLADEYSEMLKALEEMNKEEAN